MVEMSQTPMPARVSQNSMNADIDSEKLEGVLEESMNADFDPENLAGVGLGLGVQKMEDEDGKLRVVVEALVCGASAEESGLVHVGDEIVMVDDVHLRTTGLDEGIKALLGPENTTVELQISGKRLYYESIHFVELKRTRAFSAGVNSSSRVSGVGLMLEEIATKSGKQFEVVGVVPGSPADKSSKFAIGDVLIKIDEHEVDKMRMEQVSALILGETASRVSLTMWASSSGETFQVTLIRNGVGLNTKKEAEPLKKFRAAANVINAVEAFSASLSNPTLLAQKAFHPISAPTSELVPFAIVTLDLDLSSIGDHEAFKQDVIQDLATAANVDSKHMRIAALHAGSVIADLLLAPEAGDHTNILQDLVEQSQTPDSLLKQGKFTCKAKSIAPATGEHQTNIKKVTNKLLRSAPPPSAVEVNQAQIMHHIKKDSAKKTQRSSRPSGPPPLTRPKKLVILSENLLLIAVSVTLLKPMIDRHTARMGETVAMPAATPPLDDTFNLPIIMGILITCALLTGSAMLRFRKDKGAGMIVEEASGQLVMQNKNKSGKKALKSSLPSRAVKEALVKAVPARSLVTGVTGVFSFLRQTGFDKVAQGAFLVFQAAPSDVSSWMFGDSVMLGDVYYSKAARWYEVGKQVDIPLQAPRQFAYFDAFPPLPQGLQMQRDGSISGTPQKASVMRDYTIQMVEVNGNNASKRMTIPLRFGVIESMEELQYASTDVIYVKGNALRIKVESKKEMGNLIFSVTPDLPDGLNFDANSGGIWGKVKDRDGKAWHGTVTVQNNKLQTKTLSLTIRQGSWEAKAAQEAKAAREAKAAQEKANQHKAKLRLESRKTLGERLSLADTGHGLSLGLRLAQVRRFLV